MYRLIAALICFIYLHSPALAGEVHGRVVDRGTLKLDGSAKGISGVKILLYEGQRLITSTVTNANGSYRLNKIQAVHARLTYRMKGFHPSSISRDYVLSDTSSRDVYLDADHREEGALAGKSHGGYYQGVADGMLALSRNASFFGEDQDDSLLDLSAFFDGRDTSRNYVGVLCELLWAELLSQDRPLETRYYVAAALAPVLDSLGWGNLRGMDRYLEVSPEAVAKTGLSLRKAFRNLAALPNPADIHKLGMSVPLASQMANEYLADPEVSEKSKDRFLVQWKKAWGKNAPSFQEDNDGGPFAPNVLLSKLAASRSNNAEVQYLRGRELFAVRNYIAAAEALSSANRLAGSHPAAKYLEAMAYMRLGRNQEAQVRLQGLLEVSDVYWKAQAYRGLARLAEKAGRHSEAVAQLWKSEHLLPDDENLNALAEASLQMSDRGEIEKLLEAKVSSSGDARAHYWLGRYAEQDDQSGVAEDHYRKAWAAAPLAIYAEALGRIYLAREDFQSMLRLLEPVRANLTPEGRNSFAKGLLQVGRVQEAAKEYSLVLAAQPDPDALAHFVEALIQCNRAKEALAAVTAFTNQSQPLTKLALAKAHIANHDAASAKPILELLLKGQRSNPEYHYWLGQAFYELHNYSKAKNAFEEALRYRQDYMEATYYCALCAVKLGKSDGARGLFNELTQRNSAEWKAKGLLGMGIAFTAQQKPEAAESYFRRSQEVHETAEAEAMLALSRRRLGGPEMWVALAQKAYAIDPSQPKAVEAMGEALLIQGNKVQALDLFKGALESNPGSCELLTGLAKCQFLTGAYDEVKSTSSNAMSVCPQDPYSYYYAALTSEKLQNRKEAEGYFKGFRKAGGDNALLPQEYR